MWESETAKETQRINHVVNNQKYVTDSPETYEQRISRIGKEMMVKWADTLEWLKDK